MPRFLTQSDVDPTLPFPERRLVVDRDSPKLWYRFAGWHHDHFNGMGHPDGLVELVDARGDMHIDAAEFAADDYREMDWREAVLLGLA